MLKFPSLLFILNLICFFYHRHEGDILIINFKPLTQDDKLVFARNPHEALLLMHFIFLNSSLWIVNLKQKIKNLSTESWLLPVLLSYLTLGQKQFS